AIVQGEHFTCDEKVQRTCVGEDIVWCCDLKEKCGVTPVTCWP
ncbi:21460_t:CDS:2, partial [Gigaspora rosea]